MTFITSRHSTKLMSEICFSRRNAALFTRISMRPNFFSAASASATRGLVVSHVAKNGDCLPTGLLDLADDAVGLGLVRSYIYDDGSAGFGQRQCDRTADIAPGAGDDGNLPGEFFALTP
jgi:hypothetical protein